MRAEPARPDLWGARVSNDPGLPDHATPVRPRSDRGRQTTEEQASPQEGVRYCPCQIRRDVAPTSPRQGV